MPTTPRKNDPPTDLDVAEPTTPEAAAPAGDTVTLAVGYPHDEFVPFGKDDADHKLVITSAGTPVPAGRVEDVKAAAKDADVTIREVK